MKKLFLIFSVVSTLWGGRAHLEDSCMAYLTYYSSRFHLDWDVNRQNINQLFQYILPEDKHRGNSIKQNIRVLYRISIYHPTYDQNHSPLFLINYILKYYNIHENNINNYRFLRNQR